MFIYYVICHISDIIHILDQDKQAKSVQSSAPHPPHQSIDVCPISELGRCILDMFARVSSNVSNELDRLLIVNNR